MAPRHAQRELPQPPTPSHPTPRLLYHNPPLFSSIYFDLLSCIPITMSTFDQTKDTAGQKAQETKDLGQEKASQAQDAINVSQGGPSEGRCR